MAIKSLFEALKIACTGSVKALGTFSVKMLTRAVMPGRSRSFALMSPTVRWKYLPDSPLIERADHHVGDLGPNIAL